MKFTLRQLHVFVEAAADENFRVTADRLHLSQPSISNHIDALERATGQRLFLRSRGLAVRLSSAGHELLAHAKSMLRDAAALGAGASARDGLRTERNYVLRVAAGHYLVDQWIRQCLPPYFAQGNVPGVEVAVLASSDEMLSQLLAGHVDAIFYTGRSEPRHEGLAVEVLRRVTNSLYGTPAMVASVGSSPERISRAPTIGLPTGSTYDRNLRDRMAVCGIRPRNVVARSEFAGVTLELALAGVGLGMLFDEQVTEYVAKGLLARVPVDFEPGYRLLVTRRGFSEPRAAVPLDYLRKSLQGARPPHGDGR